jgi:predicted O-methyltransferase YrrM
MDMLAPILGTSGSQLKLYYDELLSETLFHEHLQAVSDEIQRSEIGTGTTDWIDCETIYIVIRAMKPEHLVETGVQFGATTAYMLLALEHNQKGFLHSIDLPWAGVGMPGEALGIGCLIPGLLKSRWNLVLGDSRQELQPLLSQLESIDLFNHDSLHTPKHMTWEYRTAWDHLRPGGILASHDIRRNNAFQRFCKRQGNMPYVLIYNQGIALKVDKRS